MRISDWSSDVCSSDLLIGVCGATLFYGDGVITPAISVVGAMEGLEVVAPSLDRYVVSGSLVILIGLFMIQRFGTGKVGKAFGPVLLLWFIVLGVSGIDRKSTRLNSSH